MHCFTREESLWASCSCAHKSQKVSENHTVLPIDEDMKRKLLGVKLSSKSQKSIFLCDCCKADKENENDDVPTAMMLCTNCDESQCDNCSGKHKKQKLSRDHKTVPINEKMKEKLSEMKEPSTSDGKIFFCDSCYADKDKENDEVPTATFFCTDCEESHCDDCSRAYKKQKQSKGHKVVPIDENKKSRLHKENIPLKSDEGPIFCDSCNAGKENQNDDVPTAMMFGTNCDKRQCDNGNGIHKKQTLSKDHKIVLIVEKLKKKLSKMKEPFKSDEETIFCDSCNEIVERKKHEIETRLTSECSYAGERKSDAKTLCESTEQVKDVDVGQKGPPLHFANPKDETRWPWFWSPFLFSYDGERESVAKTLCESTEQVKDVDVGHFASPKGETRRPIFWSYAGKREGVAKTLCETTRLVKDVDVGQKGPLLHFANYYQYSIRSWFSNTADSLNSYFSKPEHAFRSNTLDSLMDSKDSTHAKFGLASDYPKIQRRLGCG